MRRQQGGRGETHGRTNCGSTRKVGRGMLLLSRFLFSPIAHLNSIPFDQMIANAESAIMETP